mmetsp:Transcript_28468/g.76035  ORF Transcript_28468/g.76035 Transcript_28468/m.76035 type:complete len:216 (+) Transcript_28468:991-1638(+)
MIRGSTATRREPLEEFVRSILSTDGAVTSTVLRFSVTSCARNTSAMIVRRAYVSASGRAMKHSMGISMPIFAVSDEARSFDAATPGFSSGAKLREEAAAARKRSDLSRPTLLQRHGRLSPAGASRRRSGRAAGRSAGAAAPGAEDRPTPDAPYLTPSALSDSGAGTSTTRPPLLGSLHDAAPKQPARTAPVRPRGGISRKWPGCRNPRWPRAKMA